MTMPGRVEAALDAFVEIELQREVVRPGHPGANRDVHRRLGQGQHADLHRLVAQQLRGVALDDLAEQALRLAQVGVVGDAEDQIEPAAWARSSS